MTALGELIALAASPLLIASMTSSPVLVASGAVLRFAFSGSAITLLLTWRQISHIAAAPPALGDEASPQG